MSESVEKAKDPEIVKLEESGTLALLRDSDQIVELHTILKDRNTDHSDFVFYADRLMRLVIEEALNKLPYTEVTITTPTHCQYKGGQFLGDEQRVLYARLIPDMSSRRVLLLYPVVSTGATVLKAVSALIDSKVAEENIYLTTLFITPQSMKNICAKFPRVTVITSDVTNSVPYSFAMKYFGTD